MIFMNSGPDFIGIPAFLGTTVDASLRCQSVKSRELGAFWRPVTLSSQDFTIRTAKWTVAMAFFAIATLRCLSAVIGGEKIAALPNGTSQL